MRGEATDELRDCQIRRNSQNVLAIAHGWDVFSVVLLLTPHSPDAAQHTGSFVEPNILLGAALACMTACGGAERTSPQNAYVGEVPGKGFANARR